MEGILSKKNRMLLQLEAAKASGGGLRDVFRFASEAATLESLIAQEHLTNKRREDAAISLFSAASCMADARRRHEAHRLLKLALETTENERLAEIIRAEIGEGAVDRIPSDVFWSLSVNIEHNERLRTPQRQAYLAAKLHFNRSSDHAIVQLPVGCGKTGVMAILPFGLAKGRTLVITPNLEITRNVSRSLDYTNADSFFRIANVIQNGAGPTAAVLDSDANVLDSDASDFVVSNIQQLATNPKKWLDRFPIGYFSMILVDEGHHNVASSWQMVFDRFPTAMVTSFTATPLRSDGQRVEGKRIYRYPVESAIREGYVKDLAARRLEPKEIYFTYKGSERRHTLEEVLELREENWFSRGVALSPECNRSIVDASIQSMQELRSSGEAKHQIIAAACSIDHAKAIRSAYEERGVNAAVIHSNMPSAEQDEIRRDLERGDLDVIVQVQMLGEGADYPSLSVAAIFRPYRHLVPYVQFVGRIMRVIKQNAPGDPDNRGYVISHAGLNVDRWWKELKLLDEDDQAFFEGIAKNDREFQLNGSMASSGRRRRFSSSMDVIEEVIDRFVEVQFLEEDRGAIVDEIIHALGMRGFDLESLGLTRAEIEGRVAKVVSPVRTGVVRKMPVQPQRTRIEARKRLNERVLSGAKQLLNELGMSVLGVELSLRFPATGTRNNLGAASVLINKEVQSFLGTTTGERDLLTTEELKRAHDSMDEIIDRVAQRVRSVSDDEGNA